MKRSVHGRVVAAGLVAVGLVAACSDDSDYAIPPSPPFSRPSTSSTASSASSSSSSSGTSGTGEVYCQDRAYCGSRGCCPDGWRCIRNDCVAPGVTCEADADCSGGRFCAVEMVEPRCFPRLTWCGDEGETASSCTLGRCPDGVDVSIETASSTCNRVKFTIHNYGHHTLAPGALFEIEQRVLPSKGDAGADAGDADGGARITVTTEATTDAVLPDELTLVTLPAKIEPRAILTIRVVRDAGAASTDCYPENDVDSPFNGCAAVK